MIKCTLGLSLLLLSTAIVILLAAGTTTAAPSTAAVAGRTQRGHGHHHQHQQPHQHQHQQHQQQQLQPFHHGGGRVHKHSRRNEPTQAWMDDNCDEWVDPCGAADRCLNKRTAAAAASATAQHSIAPTQRINTTGQKGAKHSLGPLRAQVDVLIGQMEHLHVINTSDIAEWFAHNATYEFLHQLNTTKTSITLAEWHYHIQIYVGAFQNLTRKAHIVDALRNDGRSKSSELAIMMTFARSLLCEVEGAYRRAHPHQLPVVLNRSYMDKVLQFRDAHQPDSVDLRFAKWRFARYLDALQTILGQPRPVRPSTAAESPVTKSLESRRSRLKSQRLHLVQQKRECRKMPALRQAVCVERMQQKLNQVKQRLAAVKQKFAAQRRAQVLAAGGHRKRPTVGASKLLKISDVEKRQRQRNGSNATRRG